MRKTNEFISVVMAFILVIAISACSSVSSNDAYNKATNKLSDDSKEYSNEVSKEDSEENSEEDVEEKLNKKKQSLYDNIIIGCIAPITGSDASYGTSVRNGVKMAVDEINASGGILGKEVELIEADDKGDEVEAQNQYSKLVSKNKAVAIIGSVTSYPTMSIVKNASKDGIPLITPTATLFEITNSGSNIFRACFLNTFQSEAMANFAFYDLDKKTAAIIYNNSKEDNYSKQFAVAFENYFTALGGTIVAKETYETDDENFSNQLSNIKQKRPGVLFIPDYDKTVSVIAKQSKDIGIESTLLGTDGWDIILEYVENANVLEDSYFTTHFFSEDSSENVQNFVSKYTEVYSVTPNTFAALGYDSAYIMCNAIQRAGTTEKMSVIAALNATNMQGITGEITFDENGNPIKVASIIKISNGRQFLYKKYPE